MKNRALINTIWMGKQPPSPRTQTSETQIDIRSGGLAKGAHIFHNKYIRLTGHFILHIIVFISFL